MEKENQASLTKTFSLRKTVSVYADFKKRVKTPWMKKLNSALCKRLELLVQLFSGTNDKAQSVPLRVIRQREGPLWRLWSTKLWNRCNVSKCKNTKTFSSKSKVQPSQKTALQTQAHTKMTTVSHSVSKWRSEKKSFNRCHQNRLTQKSLHGAASTRAPKTRLFCQRNPRRPVESQPMSKQL